MALSTARLIFLSVVAAVFLFTYLADFNLLAVILEAIGYAAPVVRKFAALFLALSFSSLSVYYILSKSVKNPATERYIAWIRIFSFSFFLGFVLSIVIIYLNIYFNHNFDI